MPEVIQHGDAEFVRRQAIREAFKVGIDFPVGAKSFALQFQESSDDGFFSCGGDDAEPDSDGYDSGRFIDVLSNCHKPKGFVTAWDDDMDCDGSPACVEVSKKSYLQQDECSVEVLTEKGQQRPAVSTLEKRTDGVPLAYSGDSAVNLELRPLSVKQIHNLLLQWSVSAQSASAVKCFQHSLLLQ